MRQPIAIITHLGREETIDAENSGLTVSMSRIAIGPEVWTQPPDATVTAMKSKSIEYFPIIDASKATANRLHLTSKIDGDSEYSFYEFALLAKKKGSQEDFVFAIAASTDLDKPLGVKRKGVTLLLSFDLTLVGFKEDTIFVTQEAPRLNLSLAEEFATVANAFVNQTALIKKLIDEISLLKSRVSQLEKR